MHRKRLLLFASKLGYQTRSFDEAAQELGVDLTFVTDRCHQLDDPWGDRAIPVHFESPDAAAYEVLEAVRSSGPVDGEVDGVLALGDRPAVAAAYVARGLGLQYNHPAAAEACRSKLRTREIFRDAGLRVPWFRSVSLQPAPEPSLLGISYPCVLKPLSLSASQGVVRANNREEFLVAAARIHRLLASPEIAAKREPNLDQMIVEGYIPGREVAVEGLLTEGVLRILAIFDKPDPLDGPYFEETVYVTPSLLPEAQQREVERCAAEAARALGLSARPSSCGVSHQRRWCVAAGGCAPAHRWSLRACVTVSERAKQRDDWPGRAAAASRRRSAGQRLATRSIGLRRDDDPGPTEWSSRKSRWRRRGPRNTRCQRIANHRAPSRPHHRVARGLELSGISLR